MFRCPARRPLQQQISIPPCNGPHFWRTPPADPVEFASALQPKTCGPGEVAGSFTRHSRIAHLIAKIMGENGHRGHTSSFGLFFFGVFWVTWWLLTWFWGSTSETSHMISLYFIAIAYCLALPYKRLWQHAEFVHVAAGNSRWNGADQPPYFPWCLMPPYSSYTTVSYSIIRLYHESISISLSLYEWQTKLETTCNGHGQNGWSPIGCEGLYVWI